MFASTLSQSLVTVTLTASAEHISAFAHNLGGDRLSTQTEGDRTVLTFAFEDYSKAANFQLSLGTVSGVVSAAISKQ
jgi:hypothetical protein